ncbi:MAG: protein kinase [Bacteroidota bacterium]
MSVYIPKLTNIAELYCKTHDYTNFVFVGNGAFKETYKISVNGDIKALKLFNPDNQNPIRTAREINAIKKCDYTGIAKLYSHGIIDDKLKNKYCYIVEEYFDGGTLTDRMSSLLNNVPRINQYTKAFIFALKYLRMVNLVHRDIKPDNVMFLSNSEAPVLVDFGIVRDLSLVSATAGWIPRGPGTPFYSSPEQLNNDKHLISWRTDQFSIGIVVSMCLLGFHPYFEPGLNDLDVVENVADRKGYTNYFKEKTEKLNVGWIQRMVEGWPNRRFQDPDDILEMLM